MAKVRLEGIPFASVLKLATKSFVEGSLDVQMVSRPVLNDKTRKMLDSALKNIKAGKNLSPGFDNAKDASAYLRAL